MPSLLIYFLLFCDVASVRFFSHCEKYSINKSIVFALTSFINLANNVHLFSIFNETFVNTSLQTICPNNFLRYLHHLCNYCQS